MQINSRKGRIVIFNITLHIVRHNSSQPGAITAAVLFFFFLLRTGLLKPMLELWQGWAQLSPPEAAQTTTSQESFALRFMLCSYCAPNEIWIPLREQR